MFKSIQPMIVDTNRQFTLWEMHVKPTLMLRKQHEALFKKPLLDGKPQMKGVVLKTGLQLNLICFVFIYKL